MSKKIFIPSLIILFAVSAFLISRSYQNEETPNTANSNSTATPATSSIPLNSDLLTYRNKKYALEFNYPKDWSIQAGESVAKIIPLKKSKEEEAYITFEALTGRPKGTSLASHLTGLPPDLKCEKESQIGNYTWCFVDERFEAIRRDIYGFTQNNVDYVVTLHVRYGRQQMTYYISDDELKSELTALNSILNSFTIAPEKNYSSVAVYFGNTQEDPNSAECNKVYSTFRTIQKTQTVARATVEELLKGPNEAEKQVGFFTSINSNVKIKDLQIKDGVATIEFDSQLEFQVGGSCKVSAIKAQITQTLKQFPSIKDVVISIDGRTEDILQP